jgi:hypothetical protein
MSRRYLPAVKIGCTLCRLQCWTLLPHFGTKLLRFNDRFEEGIFDNSTAAEGLSEP